ncbi:MutS-related protein [Flavobacterium succinicans]|uniref:DNA mismatch repair protein MutS n=1 Tax=Flavobacterium succinicans TaxID=29536 RepID=A0A199XV69_9FLAO|nr:DNA mismatch repair protein [Flavobacterium succinicans]OAZ05327.1 DNA mismatch repair protein MutS [Flavobacterium succinicans]
MEIYIQKKALYEAQVKQLQQHYNRISLGRLGSVLVLILAIYGYQKNNSSSWVYLGALAVAAFFVLMRWHTRVSYQKNIAQALVTINADEIDFLERKNIPFEDGIEYNDFHHPYAYDLDIFGQQSLFQSLNRTGTFMGKQILASHLLKVNSATAIEEIQEATKELGEKLDWRHTFLSIAKVSKDSEAIYQKLLRWSVFNSESVSRFAVIFAYVSPVVLVVLGISYGLTSSLVLAKFFGFLFMVNLAVAGIFLKRILSETAHSSEINSIVHNYSLLIEKIENEKFSSYKANHLQQQLVHENNKVSLQLKQLSDLFSKMDNTSNFLIAILFNGFFLYNIHILNAIVNWKKNYAINLEQSLAIIGEFEMLNSLANFSFNNPDFAFPTLNNEHKFAFEKLSHPLLNPETRVGNTVAFQPQSFLILTGSNMSGKSTFLRSLGINMVLAGMGAPVCATQANVHPLPVLVSMRLSDSLSDSESYFFAEIKRLKQIMDGLDESPAFVLLDEILRGTNSDDKRSGTIEVVKKVIAKQAIGAIATHDIEVCLTTNEFPQILTNKCFEVEIKNDELHFDYQLREGICQNKSATFLMKKMGVI